MSVRLTVHVQPKASENRVVGFDEADRLKVRVTAAPADGRANDAVTELIAGTLGIPRRQVLIERGHTSQTKILRIEGIGAPEARHVLDAARLTKGNP